MENPIGRLGFKKAFLIRELDDYVLKFRKNE